MSQFRIRRRKVGRRLPVRLALSAAVIALVVGLGSNAVRAGDDDEDGASVMQRIMQTFGLRNPDDTVMGRGDNYGERSPLVVPPTRDLPVPVSNAGPPAPNWPKDPDITRAQAAKKKVDNKAHYQRGDSVTDNARVLSPSELYQRSSKTNPGDGDYTADKSMVDPRDQGAKRGLFSGLGDMFKKEQYATFTGEPPRENLTDPPPGYLTPSPDQPYGIGQAPANYKVKSLGERLEPTR